MPDSAAVNSMFGRIAGRYDLANRLLSLGRDAAWRRRLVSAVARAAPRDVVDLATGSGDVALALAVALPSATSVRGIDFCAPMLAEAERKKAAAGPGPAARVRFELGDAQAPALPPASCDAVTIAFGLRNLPDRGAALAGMLRVLRPGGRLYVLEFSRPAAWMRPLYLPYLRHVLPRLAGRLTGDREAYVYLNRTIEDFPGRETLSREIRAAGFASVAAIPLSGGIVALHEAAAPAAPFPAAIS